MSTTTLSREEILEQARRILSDEPESLQNSADLLRDVEAFLVDFVVLPKHSPLIVALWAVYTHCYEIFDTAPYLALLSPVKQCGKTRCLELLELLCRNPWRGVAPSPAALYRMLESGPVLLLDEAETLTAGKNLSESQQTLLSVFNVGYKKGATIPRCDGPQHNVRHFPVFGPKAFASTKPLSDTLMDRSVRLSMQRKLPSQKLGRFLSGRIAPRAKELRNRIATQTGTSREAIGCAYAELDDLPFLTDRNAEIFLPLFATLTVLDSSRMDELRRCAIALMATKRADDEDSQTNLKLLLDIRAIWPTGAAHISSATLLESLRELEESPWREFDLTVRRLAHRLRPFEIQTRDVRIGGVVSKGYKRDEFEPAFDRYLAIDGDSSATSATTRINIGGNDDFTSAT